MRCKNCGWDNPDGNNKCVKCNALLSDYENERTPQFGYVADDYNPRVTVVGNTSNNFNPQATAIGCIACGYPVRPVETECPACGHSVTGSKKETEPDKPVSKDPLFIGTIIQGANLDEEKTNMERKKLTGFLVTYSLTPNGDFFPLYEGKNVIGRSASSNVYIKGDSAISEKHFSILYRAIDRKFKFKDEQSSNGTFINEELLDEGELKTFDKIRIGTTLLLFIEIPLSSFE